MSGLSGMSFWTEEDFPPPWDMTEAIPVLPETMEPFLEPGEEGENGKGEKEISKNSGLDQAA